MNRSKRMLKITATLGVMLLMSCVTYSLAQEIEKTYYFKEPNISPAGIYARISFTGTTIFGEPGKPGLPFYAVRLLLPPGESATAIEYEFFDPVLLPGTYQLMPQQTYRPLSYTGETEFLIDTITYRSSDPFPGDLQYQVSTHFMNGHGFALSAFTPVSYVPAEGKLTYYRQVRVRVHTRPDARAARALQNIGQSQLILSRVLSYAQNPGQLPAYAGRSNPPRIGEYSYLLVTTDTFAQELDTLIRFYEDRGIKARCYTLSYIDTAATGEDMQEKIRDFIIDEYQDNSIEYVLLGGDAGIVPYRGFYCSVFSGGSYVTETNIPADLYFSALDGNWNNDGDGYWGEPGEGDLLPEVAVGRLTWGDTVELKNMIRKLFHYQTNPVTTDLNRPLLAGENLYTGPDTWGSDYLRLLIGYHSDSGYVTNGIPPWHDIDTLYDRYSYWNKQRLIDSINNGHSYIHHVGHANYTYVMKLYNSDITDANFSQVDGVSHNYPVVYTHGCNCGGFDRSDCIAERMIGIEKFAVAFVGNSRYGWFVEGTADGPSQHLHREFVDALYTDSLYRLGMAHMQSKAETAPFLDLPDEYEPGAHRWCFYDCNALGDPMLALWTDFPHSVIASHPPMIKIGEDTLSVTIRYQGSTQKGVVCGLFQADSLLGCAQTDSTGSCQIPLGAGPAEGQAVLRVSGFNVLAQDQTIPVADYWIGLSSDWNDPANWYTEEVPDQYTNVIIPANPSGSHYPDITAFSSSHCKNLFVEQGAAIYLDQNDNLILHGN